MQNAFIYNSLNNLKFLTSSTPGTGLAVYIYGSSNKLQPLKLNSSSAFYFVTTSVLFKT